MIKNKEIKLKNAIIFLGIITVISMPIIIFVLINTFDLPAIELPFLTIPRMVVNRYETETTLFSGNILINSLSNFIKSLKMLIFQYDGAGYNAIEGIGIIYIFSIPLTIIGIINEFKDKKEYTRILNLWFIVSFLMLFICKANINKCNIIIIPIIYYTIIGICEVINKVYLSKLIILLIYILSFITFEYEYFNIDWSQYYTFSNGVEEVVTYVENLEDVEKIYFPYTIKEPYIYILFYSKTSPYEYINTVQKIKENGTFENIKAFGKYEFYTNIDFIENENYIYVIPKDIELKFDEEKWEKTEFEKYVVVRYRKSLLM